MGFHVLMALSLCELLTRRYARSKVRGTCVAPRVPIVDYLLGDVGLTQSLIFRVAHANYIPRSFFDTIPIIGC